MVEYSEELEKPGTFGKPIGIFGIAGNPFGILGIDGSPPKNPPFPDFFEELLELSEVEGSDELSFFFPILETSPSFPRPPETPSPSLPKPSPSLLNPPPKSPPFLDTEEFDFEFELEGEFPDVDSVVDVEPESEAVPVKNC